MKFEIRQIDAWAAEENTWTYNETWHIGDYVQRGNDGKRAFLRACHKNGIVCNRGCCRVNYDGDIYELVNRKTEEPLFCAIPIE